jgi:ribose transport system substrate-binding protein
VTLPGSTRLRALVALGIVGIVAAAAVTTAASGRPDAARGTTAKLRIGYVLPDLANPFIAGLRDGAVAEAKKQGIALLVKGTNDSKGQTDAMLAYVGAKVDAIGVDAIDGAAISPAVKAANKAGIPVIAIQAQPSSGKVATFIAANNKQGGVLIGKSIVEYCKGKNPCKLGVVEGNLADQSGRDENSGMRSVVATAKNIKIVGHQPTDYDPVKALNVATNLLTANPDLNYIYSWWDQGALAALQAAKSKKLAGKIGIAGFGGNCLNLAEVIKGNIHHETTFFPQSMGAQMVQAAAKATKGQKLPAITPAPILGVTTKYANALLSGKAKPPAGVGILEKLKQAKSGKCPK